MAVIEEKGRIIAHVGAVNRTIRFGLQLEQRARVAGMQNAWILPHDSGGTGKGSRDR